MVLAVKTGLKYIAFHDISCRSYGYVTLLPPGSINKQIVIDFIDRW